ncbi:MAG: flotillin family protein [Planctomycetes bacterium]|nr:flotillin family protein [Planctomycetota bacterium]MCB9909511.1 flotillin family protein [Planctomycetota bacterium]MCB9912522.1 flotillin family protein [Planctomycetota bacterium]HPF14159.1 SPFH domain-containing protein [Planctomycetota bacterium]
MMPLAFAKSAFPENAVPALIALLVIVVLAGFFLIIARRYKRCPSNKILVIYGRTSRGQTAKTVHGGGTFVWPLLQSYDYISLEPMQIEIPLQGALSLENIRVSVPSVFTVAVGTETEQMNNAAVRLLSLTRGEIMKQAEDIIFGQLRQVIASMKIEEINKDRDVFLTKVQSSLEPELSKIGLVLINVNIKDLTDESGYIEAIGRKAASEAINQAEIDVAKQEQLGAIGVAAADKERSIQVAELEKVRDVGTKSAERDRSVEIAELDRDRIIGEKRAEFTRESAVRDAQREMRIQVADADAHAVTGENEARALIAKTNADLQVQEANAYQIGETRQREAKAAVLEAEYLAQAKAAEAQGKKIEAEKRAELEATARAVKAQTIVDAEAAAERDRIRAEGEAKANFARLEAEARGQYEILAKKGQGLREIIESCGGADQAFRMLMLEHIDHIAETAANAISNIKFDKIVVWDGAQGGDGTGGTGTSRFLRGLAGSLPPALQMMRDIGGVEMPDFFGKLILEDDQPKAPDADSEAPDGDAKPGKTPPKGS